MSRLIDFRGLSIVLIVGIVLLFIPQSQALQCYGCTSSPSGPCGQNFNANHTDVRKETCGPDSSCGKLYAKAPGLGETYTRVCVTHQEDSSTCTGASGAKSCTYICNKDLCNGTKSIHSSIFITIFILSAISMLIN